MQTLRLWTSTITNCSPVIPPHNPLKNHQFQAKTAVGLVRIIRMGGNHSQGFGTVSEAIYGVILMVWGRVEKLAALRYTIAQMCSFHYINFVI